MVTNGWLKSIGHGRKNFIIWKIMYIYNLTQPFIDSSFFIIDKILEDDQIKNLEKYVENEMPLKPAEYLTGENDFESKIRSTDISWINVERFPEIYTRLGEAIHFANNNFFKYSITYLEPCQYGVYDADKNGHYSTHCDTGIKGENNDTRKISFSILLSDPNDFDGGDLILETTPNGIDCDLKYNQMFLFPSFLPHKVTPVTRGVRKSLVGWVHGPNFV